MVFKRKTYQKMLEWKEMFSGKRALLIEGARRVGKTTLALEFAKREYKSYLLLDFSRVGKSVKELFEDLSNLDLFFIKLKTLFPNILFENESVIIFDEVQLFPLVRQAIKHLVEDGRLESGKAVSETSAMQITAVYTCVRILSEAVVRCNLLFDYFPIAFLLVPALLIYPFSTSDVKTLDIFNSKTSVSYEMLGLLINSNNTFSLSVRLAEIDFCHLQPLKFHIFNH